MQSSKPLNVVSIKTSSFEINEYVREATDKLNIKIQEHEKEREINKKLMMTYLIKK